MAMKTLPLKMVQPYEIIKCDLSGDLMFAGDWYYYDARIDKRYLYEAYHHMRKEVKENAFDFNKLYQAQSVTEYKNILKAYEKENTKYSILQEIENELSSNERRQ